MLICFFFFRTRTLISLQVSSLIPTLNRLRQRLVQQKAESTPRMMAAITGHAQQQLPVKAFSALQLRPLLLFRNTPSSFGPQHQYSCELQRSCRVESGRYVRLMPGQLPSSESNELQHAARNLRSLLSEMKLQAFQMFICLIPI